MLIALYLNFQHSIFIAVLAYARLAIIFYMLPVFGERVLSNLIIKNTIIFLTIIGLWPCIQAVVNPEQGWLILLAKECSIGLLLAGLLSVPFWIVMNLGEILDNQRGATISESIDPVNGVQSSILSGFFNFAFGAIFFASGGMYLLLDVLIQSYEVFPRGSSLDGVDWRRTGHLLVVVVKNSILLAAPVLVAMLTAEILLGIFARYCPQLNPFSLSLTVKSFIAFSIFLFYGFYALTDKSLPVLSASSFSDFFID